MMVGSETLADRLIKRSDLRAERLIGLLRMGLSSLLFAGVGFVLSQSETAGLGARRFELLCLLFGAVAYFAIGALTFYCATPERARPWMAWAFNMAEVVLVAFQLYIDVRDPQTPSLLAFASPVILVAALVICVQVLRYQIKLHVFTTLLLILLCALIVFHDPQTGRALSNPALHELQLVYTVPPNVMRLVMLTAMAALIGVAVVRSRRLVETAARETEMAENRKRFLPAEISSRMRDGDLDLMRSGEERDLAVLFVDIRSFTALSAKLGPRGTSEYLSHFRGLASDAARANGGFVDKFIGDGALVIFGMHSAIAQACRDAFAAAEQIEREVADWNAARTQVARPPTQIVIGIHCGPAIIGAIGDARRLEFTAVGNTVNLAARLEEAAKQHGWRLAISRDFAQTAGLDAGNFAVADQVALRGIDDQMHILGQPQTPPGGSEITPKNETGFANK